MEYELEKKKLIEAKNLAKIEFDKSNKLLQNFIRDETIREKRKHIGKYFKETQFNSHFYIFDVDMNGSSFICLEVNVEYGLYRITNTFDPFDEDFNKNAIISKEEFINEKIKVLEKLEKIIC